MPHPLLLHQPLALHFVNLPSQHLASLILVVAYMYINKLV